MSERLVSLEVKPGDYISGEDAMHQGANERPIIGGITTGKNPEGDYKIITHENDEFVHGSIVDNERIVRRSIPQDKYDKLKPIQDHLRQVK